MPQTCENHALKKGMRVGVGAAKKREELLDHKTPDQKTFGVKN